jgi:predicted RND superfamily exporter protein
MRRVAALIIRILRGFTPRALVISLIVLAIGAVVTGGLLRVKVETTVDSFLPRGDPSVAALEDQAKTFGGDPIVAIVESEAPQQLLLGAQQFSKLMKLEGTLSQLPDVATVYGPATVMNQIAIASQDMIARLSGTRDGLRVQGENAAKAKHLSDSAVQTAGDAATADFDKRYGSLLVRGLPGGLPTTNNPNFVKNVIYDETGVPRARWHFVVPGANSIAVLVRPRQDIDGASTRRLVSSVQHAVAGAGLESSKVTITGVPVVTAALTTEAAQEAPLLGGLAFLVILLRFLVAPARSGWIRRTWPLLAAVVGGAVTLAGFGWAGVSMSFGAIVLLPLLLGIGSSFPLYLATMADRRRVIVVSLASAVAFASLAVSPLPFVQELGIALSLGVVLTVAAMLALAKTFDVGPPAEEFVPAEASVPVARRWVVLSCLVAIAAVGWTVLPRIDVEANPEDIAQGLPELTQAQYAERVLGSSGDVSIVLRGPDVQSPQALRWLTEAENIEISKFGDRIRPILTAPDLVNFLGGTPTAEQVAAGLQLLPPYLTRAVFSPDGQQAVMTFGLKFQDLGVQTALLDDIRSALPPPPSGSSVDVVGLPVAASRAYQLVSSGRYLANLVGIAAAGLVLLIGLRRRNDAWRAMLAAALATGWTIAGLWLLGQAFNPLTMALGSLSTVTACEFTVLLLDGRQRRKSKLRRMVGWACATSAIGYLALVPSRIGLLREFGITMAATVLLSYVAATAIVRLWPDVKAGRASPPQRKPSPRPGARKPSPVPRLVQVPDTEPAEVSS